MPMTPRHVALFIDTLNSYGTTIGAEIVLSTQRTITAETVNKVFSDIYTQSGISSSYIDVNAEDSEKDRQFDLITSDIMSQLGGNF